MCSVAPDRRPGSIGNDEATSYVSARFTEHGWTVATQQFGCLDWDSSGATLDLGAHTIDLSPSPYGLGVTASGPVRILRDKEDLHRDDLAGSIAVVAGALASEPLTPKAYPFYGSAEHAQTISALEAARPAAVVAVTGLYPALCGALDPFPWIEDGDFSIPTANVRPEDAGSLLEHDGRPASIEIRARRTPAEARNVVGTRGPTGNRVTVIAHVDSKPGTPGAVDNAAGVSVLLLLAEVLSPGRRARLPVGVELLAVNGEDHFAAPGEVAWLAEHENDLDDVLLAVNIDGAGYREGRSSYSTYNVDGILADHIEGVLAIRPDLVRGPDWFQSDHAIFAARGRPAMAITTELLEEMLATLYHSPADTPDQVDVERLIGIAAALEELLTTWPV